MTDSGDAMNWAQKTYWVKGQKGDSDYAISSDMEPEELMSVLSLEANNGVITSASESTPCKTCPQLTACMGSIWTDGKRMAGPIVGEGSLSEVINCRYCVSPTLVLYKWGPENPVPEKCPRRTTRIGDCDGCRRFRSGLLELYEAPEEDVELSRSIIASVLSDTDLQGTIASMSEVEKNERLKRWVALLCGILHKNADVTRMVRALVLELTDGTLEKAWMEKTQASRRFTIRCWEGVVRRALDR